MNNQRDDLVAKQHSLELCAKIAEEARDSDIKNFIQRIVDANEIKDTTVTIHPNAGNLTRITNIIVQIVSKSDDNRISKRINILFKTNNVFQICPCVEPQSIDYAYIYSTDDLAFKRMNLALKLSKALHELKQLVNSSLFQSYESDICACLDAGKELSDFDAEQRQKKIDSIASSFVVGMKIQVGNTDKIYPITKVSRKRLMFETYGGSMPNNSWRKTIDRIECAQRIVSNEWYILP